MFPSFGTVFGEPIPAYMSMALVGFVVAVLVGVRWARRNGYDHDAIIDLGLVSLIFGFAGGRIGHVLFDGHLMDYVNLCVDPSLVAWPQFSAAECLPRGGVWDDAAAVCRPAQGDCFAWAKFWQGGLVWYGGLAGAALAGAYFLRRDGFPLPKALDLAGMVVPLGLFFGRLGCFFAGCCFGVISDHATAISFPPYSPASDAHFLVGHLHSRGMESLPVLPTQLFEAGGSLLIAALAMLVVRPHKAFDGQVFCVSMILYAMLRFGLEFLRADERGGMLGLSTSQWLGVVLVLVIAGVWRYLAAQADRSMAEATPRAAAIEPATR